ncbi:MAG TPA: YbhB/YbcL family Raf kinase inhibitor-like protein [Bryobacteraceae bacterium]|nr:YbhB/YbcL family Raf kinase inhibitor-like protein [Bryobacteraceae bacterium]
MRWILVLLAVAGLALGQSRGGRGGRGGRGRGGRGGIQNLTLITTAWPDGGMIPSRYTQSGPEISPAIEWSAPPEGTVSFVLTFTDADTVVNGSTDALLHWMLWNIPAKATGIAQGQPDGFELPDGTRQISVSGSRYRGPGAPASGPLHHYILQLYALDTMIDVKVNPQGPQEPNPNVQAIRTEIMQAMAGHIRGKAAYVGLFHRAD